MPTFDTLIEQVRAVYIQNQNLEKHEIYNQFINECNAAELSEEDFYKKVLKHAYNSIDWDAVEKEKIIQEETKKKIAKELEIKQREIQNAPIYLDRLIKIAFEDGKIEAEELNKIFSKAVELEQNIHDLAIKIDNRLDELKYKSYPRANFDAKTLKETLCSTDWYAPELYERIAVNKVIQEPLKLPPLQDALQIKFKKNGSEKLIKDDIVDIYRIYSSKNQHEVESEVYQFINTNNLVPENEKLIGRTDKEKQSSTNWIKEKKVIVFPPPGCGKWLGYLIFIAIIGVGGYYGYTMLNSGIVYHTIAIDGANIRSSPDVSSDANIIKKIVYGQTFKIKKETDLVSGFGGMWLKYNGLFSNEYASSKIFAKEKDFYLLESIFGDEITKQAIKTVKCRKALIDYYKSQNPDYEFFGKTDDITYKKIYRKPKNFTGEWQVKCTEYKKGVLNSIIYPNVYNTNSKFTDFGFIITNSSTNIKRFVLYAFDDVTEEPIFVGETDATGHNLVRHVGIRNNGMLNVTFAD